jgi:hypothetical protein
VDLEGHVAQSQFVGGGGRRTGQVVRPGEANGSVHLLISIVVSHVGECVMD